MNKFQLAVFLIALGFLLLLVESSIFSFPMVFVFSVVILSVFRNIKAGILVFILGLFADAFRVVNFGITPVFIFLTYVLIFLYEKYFGRNDYVSILAILVFATIIYSIVLSFSLFYILLAVLMLVLVWIGFAIIKVRSKIKK